MSAQASLMGQLSGRLSQLRKLPLLVRHLGWRGALSYLLRRLANRLDRQPHPVAVKNDITAFYDYLVRSAKPQTIVPAAIKARTMNWVIPHFEIGSGGHMTAFRMIQQLEQRGYQCHITLVGPSNYTNATQVRRLIRKHFMPLQARTSIGEDELKPAEFTVATSWETAYTVKRFAATRHKLYFVQDFEPHFYGHGSTYAFAEATYRFGFTAVTAGDWLAQIMRDEYGMQAYPFGFSYDKQELNYQKHAQESRPKRIFFYARSVTPRRSFELGILALNLVHQALPDVEFVLVGWDASTYHLPFKYINPGVVAASELPHYYRMCDVALVLSMTNLSLLPLELMACGCPVVSNDGPNVQWQLHHEQNALLADATAPELANALIRVLNDTDLRERLITNGLAFAQASDWHHEGEKIHGYLEQIRGTEC